MARKHQQFQKRRKPSGGGVRRSEPPREAPVPLERKPPVQYGKAFIILEDRNKNTFEYANGAWIPYAMSIAQCKKDCQVKELPQKVNDKTRYEIRAPLPTES
jgi:hypothetical protein